MAALNFPDPAVTQTYTEAGITWTWNATLGVWSSEPGAGSGYLTQVDLAYIPDGDNAAEINNTGGNNATVPIATDTVAGLFTGAEKQKLAGIEDGAQVNGSGSDFDQTAADGLYLSKVNDDTAAGEITFEGLTTHEAGVTLTGGHVRAGGSKTGAARSFEGSGTVDAGTTDFRPFYSNNSYTGTGTIPSVYHFQAQPIRPTSGLVITEQMGFYAGTNLTADTVTNAYGFYSDLGTGPGNNYNFYAEGSAPNYFTGKTTVDNNFTVGTTTINPVSAPVTGCAIRTSGNFITNVQGANAPHQFRRDTDGELIRFHNNSTVSAGSISVSGNAIQIDGLAGGPLLRNGFDLDSSEGIVDAVRNVVDRVAAIEANEVIDDATDTSLLQLLANASARLDSIEARLAALEGTST